jgi:hypothetical protein
VASAQRGNALRLFFVESTVVDIFRPRDRTPRILPEMRAFRTAGSLDADRAPPTYLAARCQIRLSQGASQTCVRRAPPRAATGRMRADSLPTRFADAPRTVAPAARPRRRGRLAPLPFNMLSPSCARKRSSRDAVRRRARQSACLRKNAGMSYVSTPFSCSACTCEAAVSRELRQTAGVSNAP